MTSYRKILLCYDGSREGRKALRQGANLAESLQVDLVVVGHRCRNGLARWWMGADNTPLLDRVKCSILVAVCQAGELAEAEDEAAYEAKPVKAEAGA